MEWNWCDDRHKMLLNTHANCLLFYFILFLLKIINHIKCVTQTMIDIQPLTKWNWNKHQSLQLFLFCWTRQQIKEKTQKKLFFSACLRSDRVTINKHTKCMFTCNFTHFHHSSMRENLCVLLMSNIIWHFLLCFVDWRSNSFVVCTKWKLVWNY